MSAARPREQDEAALSSDGTSINNTARKRRRENGEKKEDIDDDDGATPPPARRQRTTARRRRRPAPVQRIPRRLLVQNPQWPALSPLQPLPPVASMLPWMMLFPPALWRLALHVLTRPDCPCPAFYTLLMFFPQDESRQKPAEPAQLDKLPVLTLQDLLPTQQESACAICLEDFIIKEAVKEQAPASSSTDPVLTVLLCNHFFHRACVTQWLKDEDGSCPVCRTRLPAAVEVAQAVV